MLLYLRSRWYSTGQGRFISRDTWQVDYNRPLSLTRWLYVEGNPINLTDPSGKSPYPANSGNKVLKYIVGRMKEDASGADIKEIYRLNNTHYREDACQAYQKMSWLQKLLVGGYYKYFSDAAELDANARITASAKFGCLVADARSRPVCGQWDYKKDIDRYWGNYQKVDFSSIGIKDEIIFYYDIWANFHFGYLGLAGGFSEDGLLTGAAIENAASNLKTQIQDDPSDTAANIIGFQMFKANSLSEGTLLWWIYIERGKLNKVRLDENGNFVEIYR